MILKPKRIYRVLLVLVSWDLFAGHDSDVYLRPCCLLKVIWGLSFQLSWCEFLDFGVFSYARRDGARNSPPSWGLIRARSIHGGRCLRKQSCMLDMFVNFCSVHKMAPRVDDVMRLCCDISSHEQIKVAVKGSAKGALMAGGGAFVGGSLRISITSLTPPLSFITNLIALQLKVGGEG